MESLELGDDLSALRSGLSSLTAIRCSANFDDNVLAGIRRPPTVLESLFAQFKVIIPAIACGALSMLILMQLGLSVPSFLSLKPSNSMMNQTIDTDKLLLQLDQRGIGSTSISLAQVCDLHTGRDYEASFKSLRMALASRFFYHSTDTQIFVWRV